MFDASWLVPRSGGDRNPGATTVLRVGGWPTGLAALRLTAPGMLAPPAFVVGMTLVTARAGWKGQIHGRG